MARSELSVSLSGLWNRHLRERGKLSGTEGIQEKRRDQKTLSRALFGEVAQRGVSEERK